MVQPWVQLPQFSEVRYCDNNCYNDIGEAQTGAWRTLHRHNLGLEYVIHGWKKAIQLKQPLIYFTLLYQKGVNISLVLTQNRGMKINYQWIMLNQRTNTEIQYLQQRYKSLKNTLPIKNERCVFLFIYVYKEANISNQYVEDNGIRGSKLPDEVQTRDLGSLMYRSTQSSADSTPTIQTASNTLKGKEMIWLWPCHSLDHKHNATWLFLQWEICSKHTSSIFLITRPCLFWNMTQKTCTALPPIVKIHQSWNGDALRSNTNTWWKGLLYAGQNNCPSLEIDMLSRNGWNPLLS